MPSRPPRLVYERDGRTLEHRLDRASCTLGRGAANDLSLDRPTISRCHARLTRRDDGWRLEDLGSLKGTTLDGEASLDRPLRDGDVIRLGRFPLTFRAAPVDWPMADGTLTLTSDELRRLPGGSPPELDPSMTTVRDTVDFSTMIAAGDAPTVERLERLLAVVTGASRAVLVRDDDETATPECREATVFRRILDLVFEHLPAERGCIMRWEPSTQTLRPVCERARVARTGHGASRPPFSRTIAATALRDRVALMTTDASADERFADGDSVVALGIRSAMCAPLWHGDRVEGLISVDTSARAGAFDRFDLDLLSALGNHLAVAIEQSRLAVSIVEQRLARRRLERYHSPAVVERIVSRDADDGGLAEEKDVTVLFADLVGFTARCESMAPREIAAWLNRCFEEMTESVFRHEGMLDKFLGDGLMAVFGAPIAQDDHARRALCAALEMRDALAALDRTDGEPAIDCRIGLHSGRVVAGDLGSHRRSDYTVLGRTVNTAARLEASVAGVGQIVVSQTTLDAAGAGFSSRPLGPRPLKGIDRPIVCHEILGETAS